MIMIEEIRKHDHNLGSTLNMESKDINKNKDNGYDISKLRNRGQNLEIPRISNFREVRKISNARIMESWDTIKMSVRLLRKIVTSRLAQMLCQKNQMMLLFVF